MANEALNAQTRSNGPALATTYEGTSAAPLEMIVPFVDYLEIPPDSIARSNASRTSLRREVLDQLEEVSHDVGLIVHGIGLSIGSADHWNEPYLHLLDEFFTRFIPRWHSEHLGFTTVNGQNLGTMLAPPRTEEMLDLVCERIRRIQERYSAPFLIEHIIHLLPDPPAEYSPAGFLNQITHRTGCGLILDAYNLECDQHNFGFDLDQFFDELDLAPVRELHLAGGSNYGGFQLDIHSQSTAGHTLALGLDIIRRCPNVEVVTYEFLKEALPNLGAEGLCAELARLRSALSPC
jgi:uncharacterized protein (UPF0276 family)